MNESKSFRLLTISTVLLFVATISIIAAIWVMNQREIRSYNQLASAVPAEDGAVKGASTTDPEYLVKLADSLKSNNFVLYGSEKNNKTQKQKEIFGQAAENIDFVECDPQVESANSLECAANNVKIYPTWAVGERKFEGYKSLSELEKMIVLIKK